MTSSLLPPRSAFAPCSPSTQLIASTTLDLPEPFGPTTHVIPGSRRSVVAEAKDLKPFSVRLLRCIGGRLRSHAPTKPAYSPRASPQFATTESTRPGASGPPSAASSSSHARWPPSAITSTRPSGRLRASPTRPSRRARRRVHHRKPTPWTRPSTTAVNRTPALGSLLTVLLRYRAVSRRGRAALLLGLVAGVLLVGGLVTAAGALRPAPTTVPISVAAPAQPAPPPLRLLIPG